MAGTGTRLGFDPPLSECPEPIAIVGMGCRWPGGVENTSQLWDLLKAKQDGWSEFSEDRINLDGFYHPNRQRPGTMYTRGGHLLRGDTRDFDHSFFGISATEAMTLDPSQRKLLEVTYEAVENAGESLEKFSGSKTGVFVGNFNNEQQIMQHRDPDHTLPYVVTGSGPTILSNRINYVFNLQGPSLVVDTACSASMYALHLAVLAIRSGDCEAAIVAGANVILGPDNQILTTKLGAASPTSRCHTFDISADGYSRAEGFGAIYLKKLSNAVSQGDPIRAVVRGTSFNANGKTGGISHPSPDGQEAVIRQAYKASGGLNPDLTGYVECHGTGTPVGDPIEVSAVGRVFSPGRKDEPLLIGSIKPNLGHSEAASAMSQIMKAVLAMEHGEIPATIGIENFNPSIDFEGARAKVVTEMTPWPAHLLRRVSINSFGYGGANAHCVLDHPSVVLPGYRLRGLPKAGEEAPDKLPQTNGNGYLSGNGELNGNGDLNGTKGHQGSSAESLPSLSWCRLANLNQIEGAGTRPLILLPVSGHDERALKANISGLAKSLERYDLADLLYTLGCRKSTFPRRAFAIVDSQAAIDGLNSDSIISGKSPSSPARRIGFIFTGQGAQWPQMGAQLLNEFGVFKSTIQYLDAVLSKLEKKPCWTIEGALLEPAATSQIHDPAFSQTLCTALQIALVALLKQWGIHPKATVGHSSGEIAAAYAAGYLKASEAIVLAYFRGQVVATNQRKGLMMAVGLEPAQIIPYLDGIEGDVKIAAINSPSSVTLSGEPEAIERLSKTMIDEGVFARVLKTGGNAYHSHHMQALGSAYEELATQGLDQVRSIVDNEPLNPIAKWVSSVTMKEVREQPSPTYWRRNLEAPVLFSSAVERLADDGSVDLLIEVGPHPALGGPLKQIRSHLEKAGFALPPCLGSLRRGEHDVTSMLTLAGNLFISNAPIDLVAVNATEKTEDGINLSHGFPCIDMPQYKYSYPETPVYYENRFNREYRTRKHLRHDILGARVPGGSKTHPQWRNVLRLKDLPWLKDHKLLPHAVLPGAAYMTMAIEAVSQLHYEAEDASPIKSFQLRQVAINSALRVEDTELGVETVLNMERLPLTNGAVMSQWYKFSVGSILPNSDEWTQHCTGTVSVTTVKTSIDESQKLKADPRSRSLDVTRWYRSFYAAGLGYGPAFQGLSNLKAYRGSDVTTSNVSLRPTADFSNESEYIIHPATLDTCIQLALISCHAGQVENFEKPFVPIFADNVTIWVPESPHEQQGLGVARGKMLGLRSVYARSQLHSLSGAPLLDIEELKCVSYDGALDASASNMVREPYWQPVERVDIETLTQAIAETMFPSKEIASSTVTELETLSAHFLASINEQMCHNSFHEKTQNHESFAKWVKSWVSSSERQDLEITRAERLAIIERLATTNLHDIPEAKCLKALHSSLNEVLGGTTNSVKVLMENNLFTDLFTSGISVSGAYSQLQHVVDLLGHRNPRMQILEVGGGSAGATSAVLETLASNSTSKRFEEYVFTDAAQWCVTEAKSRFNGHEGLVFQTLDVLQNAVSQGFETHSFDLIIAAGCLGELDSPEAALKQLHPLLKPSGSLVLLETTRSTLASEVLSRTLTGKWDHERINRGKAEWNDILKECSFSGISVSFEDYAGDQQMTTVMLSNTTGIEADAPSMTMQGAKIFLLYRDSLPLLADVTAEVLAKQGFNAIPIELFSGHEIPRNSMVVSFVDVNGSMLTCRDDSYFKALQAVLPNVSAMVWVAADLIIPGESSIMKGMLRSIAAENISSKYAFIELDFSHYTSQERVAALVVRKLNELQVPEPSEILDLECVLRGGAFHVERLLPEETLNSQFHLRNGFKNDIEERAVGTQLPTRAQYGQPGMLSSLYFTNDSDFSKPLGEDWIEIKTEAIGLNMKDIAVATARFDLNNLSTEGAGIVTGLGSAVTSFELGDRVFGMIPGNMGNYLRTPASLVSKIPDGLSTDGAASMPVVYLTSIYALKHLAGLAKGESVLIQSATGDLGMAAIQIAQSLGAEIYATVGTDEKAKILVDEFGIPASHIFNSRKLSAVKDILKATKQKGLDVILSSSGGDLMHEMWRCIAPLGHFIDVGRTDVIGGGKLGLEVFKKNATFSSFDMGLIYQQKPDLISRLMTEMMRLIQDGIIGPIRHLTTFCISRLETAMNLFSKGLHTGKFIITFRDPTATLKIARPVARAVFDPNATYLLVGCLGGLGRSLSTWMVEQGARHLAFLSRSGTNKPEAVSTVEELTAAGAYPEVIQCNVADLNALTSAVEKLSATRRVKGVIHAAMVEGDALFENAAWSQVQKVLEPKVTGTVNLHHATKSLPLDFFLMTSSIVGTVSTPSQGAYTAANAFQDSFSRFRHSQSLPATTLGLGLILEVGSVSSSIRFQQMLQRNATYGVSETEFLQLLEGALCKPHFSSEESSLSKHDASYPAQVVTGLEPARFLPYLENDRVNDLLWYNNARFQGVRQAISDRARTLASAGSNSSGGTSSIATQLQNASTPEKLDISRTAITTRLAELLGVAADDIDSNMPVSRYGVDSLVAGELRNWLIKTFGLEVSMLQLLSKNGKIEDLVKGAAKVDVVEWKLRDEVVMRSKVLENRYRIQSPPSTSFYVRMTLFNGPFRVITTLGSRVILPASYTEWLKNCSDLDHQALVHHEYFASYPGMEGNKAVTDPRKILINVTKTKLNQNSQCALLHKHITEALQEIWTDEKEWHTIDWSQDAIRFVGRMSASVFVGPELARDPDWQNLTITTTINTFMGVRALRSWPALLRPLVHWFLPECMKCREQIRLARRMLKPTFDRRAQAKAAQVEGQSVERFDDTIEWIDKEAAGRPFDPAAAQIAFAISAMHTTTELLKQTLLDVCMHPKLIPAIKDEVKKAVEESGWTTAGLFKMQLLDSVLKESQRLKPGSLVNLERKALRDVTLPNGMTLPRGTNIAVDSSMMWDPSVYPDPLTYDGYRFLRLRESGNSTAALASTSPEHIAFGIGKPICPGRFFSSNELKIALARILLSYDVKLPEGFRPKVMEMGFEMLSDPEAKVEIRRV
ncbi:Acyl transferase/acyl hydrolase/lysophospholipase [Penicillium italicum]|uniref:Acyl transferase/acyl hydrolase/lysophospholipase n=1 Tax=Penicillium italicum TaxID=40296 RepID=A0A0A2KI93_PENIT|nr:Acyl transferase/acyl hydrolase/lysophospholipase [Penicillium italicum]